MKKITKVLTGLVASLTLFGGLFFLNNLDNKNKELPNEEFNEVIGENAFFNDYGKSIDLTPKKVYESNTLLDPIIKVQISDLQEDNKRSIRFVAAIPDLNVSAKFIRVMYDEEGNEFKGRKEYVVSEAYTSIISGDSVVTPDSFGEGYNYFVTYTMNNVPRDYWYYVLDVDLVLSAKTNENIELESNGSNEANIEGLMTKYYENTFNFISINGISYTINVKEDMKDKDAYEIPSYRNIIVDNKPNVAIKDKPITGLEFYSFSGCSNLKNIEIPSTVEYLGFGAFENCYNLTSVKLPNSIYFIGERSFYGCSNLMSIMIPKSVTEIGAYCFAYCDSLTIYCESLSKPNSWDEDWCFDGNFIVRTVYWGINDTNYIKIDDVEYVMKNGEAIIGKYTGFATEIKIPATIQVNEKLYNVTSIGEMAFAINKTLKVVMLPSSITSIGWAAFLSSSINNIVIPKEVRSIQDYTFAYCSKLKNVLLPDTLESIGWYAFDGCSSLESIVIPKGVTSIGSYAFSGCSSLTIYSESVSKPSGWYYDWNDSNRPVYYAGQWEYVNGVPTPII